MRRRRPRQGGQFQHDVAAADAAFQFGRGAVGDDGAAVDDGDAGGELVCFFEVLGGEEDRRALFCQPAHDVPHDGPSARVDAGGRLVEEDDGWVQHQRHGQVQAAAHAAGIGGGRLPRYLGEVELFEQFGGAGHGALGVEVGEPRHHAKVLLAGEQSIDGGELSGDADRGADLVGFADDVVAGDANGASVGGEQGGEDVDRGRPAGAVGSEQGEHDAGRDVQVDAAQDVIVRERPVQSGDLDRRRLGGWHGAPLKEGSVRARSRPFLGVRGRIDVHSGAVRAHSTRTSRALA